MLHLQRENEQQHMDAYLATASDSGAERGTWRVPRRVVCIVGRESCVCKGSVYFITGVFKFLSPPKNRQHPFDSL